jgi:hypothetical protein
MAWIWGLPREHAEWGAEFDYDQSSPLSEMMSDEQILTTKGMPNYKSRIAVKRFKSLHSPPIGVLPVVDAEWKEIILRFVPGERVKFVPIRLNAKGEACDDFSWVIPLDKVECLDLERSVINRKIVRSDETIVFGVKEVVHKENCLGNIHLAKDIHWVGHLVLSDVLKDALSTTGQTSVFYRPEELVTVDNMFDRERENPGDTAQ